MSNFRAGGRVGREYIKTYQNREKANFHTKTVDKSNSAVRPSLTLDVRDECKA